MTLRAWNSFQYHSQGWTLSNATRTSGTGQNGLASLRSTAGIDADSYLGFTADSHFIFGFCFEHTTMLNTGEFFDLWTGGYNGGFIHFTLSAGSGGEIIVLRNNGVTEVGRSGTGVLAANVKTYIEVRVLASTTVGEVEVRVNGNPTPVIDLSGVNTQASSFDTVGLTGKPAGTRDFSAFYHVEVDGTPPNDFLGHIRFAALDPTGNGNSSGMLGSDGNSVDNYLLVDDGASSINHDSDTTYVESSTVGTKDTYAFEDMPTPPLSVVAVCPIFVAKKSDAGSRALTPVIRSDGVDYDGSDHFLSTSYAVYQEAFLEDPDTSAEWTEAGINAMEVGVKVTV